METDCIALEVVGLLSGRPKFKSYVEVMDQSRTFGEDRTIEEVATSTAYSSETDTVSLHSISISGSGGRSIFQRVCAFPLMLASLLVGVVFVYGRLFNVDPDLWWHVKVGETILRTFHWPTTDIYSFTVRGQPWLAYEWLGDVLLGTAYRLAGLPGLAAFLILVGSAVVVGLYVCATVRCGDSKAGFVAAAVMSIFAMMSFSSRPQMLGYFFLVLTVIALERFRQRKRLELWLFPIVMLLWVNTHGSWIIGMGALFTYWISGLVEFRIGSLEATRWTASERCQIAGVFLLSLLTLPITPYGTRVAASPFEFAFSLPLNIANIQEWQAMPFHEIIGKAFLLLLVLIVVAQITLNLRWRVEELLLFLFGTTMACLHVRFLLVFVPFATPLVARILALWVPPYEPAKDKLFLNAALMILVIAVVIYFFPSGADLQRRIAKTFPVAAVDYLARNDVPGPMFNNYGFGGYLVWSRGPEHKVFIDGRGDIYERGGVLSDYLHISRLEPGALSVLRSYGIQSCLLQRDEPLSTVLSASPDWRRIYVDNVVALFVHRQPWN